MKKVQATAQVNAAANNAAEPQVAAAQDVQQEQQAAPAQASEVQPEQAKVEAATEQPKRKSQTYAERKERKRLIEEGIIEPRQRIAKEQIPAGPQPLYKNGDFLKIEGVEEGAEAKVTQLRSITGLREVVAVHTNKVERKDKPEADITFAYELAGVEEPVAEHFLAQYVANILRAVK